MPNPEYRTQGKCPRCKVRHTWPEIFHRLKGSKCPYCGELLQRTTHLCAFPVVDWPSGLGHGVAGLMAMRAAMAKLLS